MKAVARVKGTVESRQGDQGSRQKIYTSQGFDEKTVKFHDVERFMQMFAEWLLACRA